MGKSRSLRSQSTRRRNQEGMISQEREQELLQELEEEREAHGVTREELEASVQALEDATVAANDAAEQEETAALELAAMRLQLERMVAGNAQSAQPSHVYERRRVG